MIFVFFKVHQLAQDGTIQPQLHQQTESNLNVDVQEFFPSRLQKSVNDTKNEITSNNNNIKENVPANLDLEKQEIKMSKVKNINHQQRLKSSQPSQNLSTRGGGQKKEIMEGVKLMEQQNINLIQKASSFNIPSINAADVEWNVIKKGKKIKVVNENELNGGDEKLPKNEKDIKITKDEEINPQSKSSENATKTQEISTTKTNNFAAQKKSPLAVTPSNNTKSRKSKNKNRKKKSQHMMARQYDGFEIIEPQFTNNNNSLSNYEENAISDEGEEDEEEEEEIIIEENLKKLNVENDENSTDNDKLELLVVNDMNEKEDQSVVSDEEKTKEVDEKMVEKMILKNFINLSDDAIIDISDEDISSAKTFEKDLQELTKEILENNIIEKENDGIQEINHEIVKVKNASSLKLEINVVEKIVDKHERSHSPTFEKVNSFANHKNIAELERDLIENLRSIDDGIDIKSPLINPLYDFPITTAVSKWLNEKQNESFDSLFHVQNYKKLSEMYDEYDDESDISDSPIKSETTDSDYGSDCQVKAMNASPSSSKSSSTASAIEKKKAINKLRMVKESFCALM